MSMIWGFIKKVFTTYNEYWCGTANDRIGFFGATPVVKPTALTTQGGTGTTNGDTTTANAVSILGISVPTFASYQQMATDINALRSSYNDLVGKYNTLRTRNNELEQKIKDLGFLP